SNACGMTSRNAAPSSAPMAYDTSIGIHELRTASASAAAAAERIPPAMLAMTIQASADMGARLYARTLGQPDGGRHALHRLVPAVGEEAILPRVRAEAAAADARYAKGGETLARDRVKVDQPMAGPSRNESRRGGFVMLEEGIAHLGTDLVGLRA